MCFSAGASFGASAVIGTIGIIAIVKAKTTPQRLFAAIPFIFSVQQFSEGMLWLSLKNPDLAAWQPFFTDTFLVFALMLWPVWIPLTIRLLEKDTTRKKIMNVLVYLGGGISFGVGCVLLIYPVQVLSTCQHLNYRVSLPQTTKNLMWLFSLLYFMATIIAPFVSGIKRMKWLGIVFIVSYLFAIIFYGGFVVSVWCYFAAVLSIVVLWIIAGLRKQA